MIRERKSRILGPNGKPVSYGFFDSGSFSGPREMPYAFYSSTQDTGQLLPTGSWQQVLSSGRFLFANVPIVRGALLEQASYAFPLEPKYAGRDKGWGKAAKEWLHEWHKIYSVRGATFSRDQISRIRLLAYKVDGDCFTVLTRTETDYPMVQHIRAHRIGNRNNDGETVKGGPYDGATIHNGAICDRLGRALAYRILGDTQADDQDVPAKDVFPTFRPDYFDQSRGISHLVASITAFTDIKRLREYEMRAQQIFASQSLIEKNEDGEPTPGADWITHPASGTDSTGTPAGLVTETYEKGMVRYFRSKSGSGLEAFRSDRPSADSQAFEDKIVTGALYGIEWDPNFALAIKEPGGAWARTVIQKVRKALANCRAVEAAACRREDGYGLAKAMKLGLLPQPSDGDWYSWEYVPTQPEITADSGNDENAKREKYKLGGLTLEDWTAQDGKWWEEHREQKELETRDLLNRAKAIATEYGLTIREAIELLEQRTPNGSQQQPAQEEAEA